MKHEESTMHPLRTTSMPEASEHSLATALYQRHAQAILMFLRNHLSVREDAEYLLLDVLLTAVEKKTLLDLP